MKTLTFFIATATLLLSCGVSKKSAAPANDEKISFTIVQVNDVYEIAPLTGGLYGGMARVATAKKQQQAVDSNTFLLMAGDFLSPSVYNSLKYQDKRIRGRQMVDVMNTAGFDVAIFGNHEFDISNAELQERLNESKFGWVSSNTFYKSENKTVPFSVRSEPIPERYFIDIKDKDGTTARIGFLGITLPTTTANYVYYKDPLTTAKEIYTQMKDSCDAVVCVTHQNIADDILLAKAIPSLPLIVGGHEHDMRFEKVQDVFITKAHSNARSAYIIKLNIDKKSRSVKVSDPQLKMLDTTVAIDSATDVVVQQWTSRANENYASLGFDPSEVLVTAGDSLEGREHFTRDTVTNLTELIVRSMQYACPDADVVIYNAGSIRLDDILYPPISQYDILRTLPFGGSIREVEMKGSLLRRIISVGESNRGAGGYLHHSALPPIDTSRTYRVSVSDFLLTGGETNLAFLTTDNPLITKVYPEATAPDDARSDIRLAIVRYLARGR